MKYIFSILCVLLVSTGVWAQEGIKKQPKQTPSIRILSFQDYRTKKQNVSERIISTADVSDRDTSVVGLGLYDKVIFCDNLSTRKILFDPCLFFYCYFVDFDFANFVFHAPADFNNSFFFEKTSFAGATFNEKVSFINATFKNSGTFNYATFDKDVTFENAQLSKHPSFSYTNFSGAVSFNQVVFREALDFQKVTCGEGIDFSEAQLPAHIYFYNTTFAHHDLSDIKSKIDFRRARLDTLRSTNKEAKCIIQFDDTDLDRFLLPYDRFSLVFGQETTYEQKISAYESIIRNCREAGMLESVESWDIDYRRLQTLHKHTWLGPLFNWFNSWWWNFGYDKWLILWCWLPFFFSLFLMYNYFRLTALWDQMYKDTELGSSFRTKANKETIEPPTQHGLQRFLFSFFYTSVIYFGFKLRHESVNYKNWRGLVYLYIMYAVGTIHMAFAFSYILSAY